MPKKPNYRLYEHFYSFFYGKNMIFNNAIEVAIPLFSIGKKVFYVLVFFNKPNAQISSNWLPLWHLHLNNLDSCIKTIIFLSPIFFCYYDIFSKPDLVFYKIEAQIDNLR
ncbi:hypothetical protein H312_00767 [Anncaliia algerae PRA339]|uniref:Uncharacterized protein n=1 Tax=Anncaliia algerae PRA339 TaxID=1288291 RepID=A0A059F4G4_9MICR|nr:hypothetical protein H312_00767 [Anncaliia algerae PRA339]